MIYQGPGYYILMLHAPPLFIHRDKTPNIQTDHTSTEVKVEVSYGKGQGHLPERGVLILHVGHDIPSFVPPPLPCQDPRHSAQNVC